MQHLDGLEREAETAGGHSLILPRIASVISASTHGASTRLRREQVATAAEGGVHNTQ